MGLNLVCAMPASIWAGMSMVSLKSARKALVWRARLCREQCPAKVRTGIDVMFAGLADDREAAA